MKHALFSASGSNIWLKCPPSLSLTVNIPDTTSPAAQEGTKMHDLAHDVLLGKKTTDNGYIETYVDYVKALGGKQYYEQKVDYSHVVDYHEPSFGTSDAIVHDGNTLHIVDYKYGTGVRVFAEENSQMMLYAIGALKSLKFKKVPKIIKLHIVQPRLDHIDIWQTNIRELSEFSDTVTKASQEAFADNDIVKFNPGESQCKWCKAKGVCPALNKKYKDMFGNVKTTALTTAEQATVLDSIPLVELFIKGVRESVIAKIKKGEKVSGYTLQAGRSIRHWTARAEEALIEELGEEEAFTKKLKGITEVEKQLGKVKLQELDITVKRPSALKLTSNHKIKDMF